MQYERTIRTRSAEPRGSAAGSVATATRGVQSSSAILVQPRPRVGAWELIGLLQGGRPEGFLLALPLGAVFEQMFTGLDAVRHHQNFESR